MAPVPLLVFCKVFAKLTAWEKGLHRNVLWRETVGAGGDSKNIVMAAVFLRK